METLVVKVLLNLILHFLVLIFLYRCGTAAIAQLLKQTSIFVHIKNSCYQQISGEPVYELSPFKFVSKKRFNDSGQGSESKRQKLASSPSSSSVLLARSSIYYSNVTEKMAKTASSGLLPDRRSSSSRLPLAVEVYFRRQTSSICSFTHFRKHRCRNFQAI